MENTTKALRMITALLLALSAGLRLSRELRETVKRAEAEVAAEDKAAEGLAKLQQVVHDAARKAANS